MITPEKLFVVWQDPKSLRYFPVGQLKYVSSAEKKYYEFVYIEGVHEAKKNNFEPFLTFPHLNQVYRSEELFPIFQNRILSHSRNDYDEFVRNLGLDPNNATPIQILSRSGGRRATDSLELFSPPQEVKGKEHLINYFFLAHGLRHMRRCAQELANNLKCGNRLFIMHDFQNPADPEALTLRTEDYCCVGFLPRYLLSDIWELIRLEKDIEVTIEKLNLSPAPIQQRILCRMETAKVEGFEPYSSGIYRPIGQNNSQSE
jgi:hypothetical protein